MISYWIDSTSKSNFLPLHDNLSVDVAIVGAGIAGITAATLLKRAGKKVAVIDSQDISAGVTYYGKSGDRLKGFATSLQDVTRDEGKIVNINGEKVAAYRDESGKVHAVSAICSHLGCVVNWNSAEKSWDCPCHGSRFNCEGKILHGPAVKDLKQR